MSTYLVGVVGPITDITLSVKSQLDVLILEEKSYEKIKCLLSCLSAASYLLDVR